MTEIFKKQFLIKYARTYGYYIVNKEDLFTKKLQYLKNWSSQFQEKKNGFERIIKNLKQEQSQFLEQTNIPSLAAFSQMTKIRSMLSLTIMRRDQLIIDNEEKFNI